jgi:hypothetical protein
MDRSKDKPAIRSETTESRRVWLETLCTVEMYFLKQGCSDFEYDEELDVFRFPEDGRFAFCGEFADWALLKERGYWPS